MRAAALVAIFCTTVLSAGLAARVITNASSSIAVGGTVTPLVIYQVGANSGASDHVAGFAIGTNMTTFTATLKGYAGATTVIVELVKFKNDDTASHAVTLSGDTITNPLVTMASLQVFNGVTSLGSLDLKTATPSLDLGTMTSGATYSCRVEFAFAVGAGTNNATLQPILRLGATP